MSQPCGKRKVLGQSVSYPEGKVIRTEESERTVPACSESAWMWTTGGGAPNSFSHPWGKVMGEDATGGRDGPDDRGVVGAPGVRALRPFCTTRPTHRTSSHPTRLFVTNTAPSRGCLRPDRVWRTEGDMGAHGRRSLPLDRDGAQNCASDPGSTET